MKLRPEQIETAIKHLQRGLALYDDESKEYAYRCGGMSATMKAALIELGALTYEEAFTPIAPVVVRGD